MNKAYAVPNRTNVLFESVPSKGYALFIALLPVLMMYKVPVIGMGVSTVMIIIGFFYAALVIFRDFLKNEKKLRIAKMVLPFIMYLIYTTIRSAGNLTNVLQTILLIFHIFAISTGAVNVKYLKKYFLFIATMAALLVTVQTLLYYAFNFHLPGIIPNLCLDNLDYYHQWILTGYPEIESMYRPSAFFLEPSHFAHYCVVAISFCLLEGKPQIIRALCLSLGVIMTTSGMGIAVVIFIWLWYALKKIRNQDLTHKAINIVGLCIVVVLILVILIQFPFFQRLLSRVLSPVKYSKDSYNAIWGRTLYWDTYITPLNGRDLLVGVGYGSLPKDDYFTGLMEMLYCTGVVGACLFYVSLLPFLFSKNFFSICVAISIGGLMILANLNGTITLIYLYGTMVALLARRKDLENEGIE